MPIRLRAPTSKPIVLKPVRPNVGIELAYRRKLLALVDDMQRSLLYWLRAKYRANEPEVTALMAEDASPARVLDSEMRKLSRQWQRNFNDGAKKLADYFATSAAERADGSLQKILRDAGFTVQFKMTAPINDALQAVMAENVGLIKSIAQKHLTEVQGIVMRSVSEGRDLSELTDRLQKQYGVARRRAEFIARDQNNKATAVINKTRRLQLGLDEAEWVHSGAGKEPRPSHVKAGAEKKRFKISEGCYIDGKYIQAGEEPNCRCTSRAIIPGLDDDDY